MKKIIRRYEANGYEIKVVEYTEGGLVEYHVDHDIDGVQKGDWYDEFRKTDAIKSAQFLAGWVTRNNIIHA